MEPDGFGLALGIGVLGGVLALFWLAVRLVSGTAALLSCAIGRAVAEGIAAWSWTERAIAPRASSPPGDGGEFSPAELDACPGRVPVLERPRSARTRVRSDHSARAVAAA